MSEYLISGRELFDHIFISRMDFNHANGLHLVKDAQNIDIMINEKGQEIVEYCSYHMHKNTYK